VINPVAGRQLPWLLLAAFVFVLVAPLLRAQSPAEGDSGFLAAIDSLREASFVEKEAVVTRLSESGHKSARPVLAAWLEERLAVRASDQKVFVVKPADENRPMLDLVDPLTLADAGSAAAGCSRRPSRASICPAQTRPCGSPR